MRIDNCSEKETLLLPLARQHEQIVIRCKKNPVKFRRTGKQRGIVQFLGVVFIGRHN